MAFIVILRIFQVEVFKRSFCSMCAGYGLSPPSHTTDLCMYAEATAKLSGCLAAKFGQTFAELLQYARHSEILDNAEYLQIPPRQNF